MAVDVYIANSHRWLYGKLRERATLDGRVALTENRRSADVIVYLSPPWPDPEAPDSLKTFSIRDLRRTYVFSQHDHPQLWAPGMYASLPASHARHGFTGGFYVAQHHREPGGLEEDLEAARGYSARFLWSFVGTLSTAPIRRRLSAISDPDAYIRDTQYYSDVVRWHWAGSHRTEARGAFATYAESLGQSAFVVCPRGYGSGSIRLFEALQVGRCPVIVSDEWSPPPFVDWSSCAIRVPEASVEDIPAILRVRHHEAARLGRNAREVWEQFFAPERQLQTIVRAALVTDSSTSQRIQDFGAWLTRPGTGLQAGLHVVRRARLQGRNSIASLVRQGNESVERVRRGRADPRQPK